MQLQAPITFVTGKGGVGKSTIAGGIALGLARRGQRVALVEFDDDEAAAARWRAQIARWRMSS